MESKGFVLKMTIVSLLPFLIVEWLTTNLIMELLCSQSRPQRTKVRIHSKALASISDPFKSFKDLLNLIEELYRVSFKQFKNFSNFFLLQKSKFSQKMFTGSVIRSAITTDHFNTNSSHSRILFLKNKTHFAHFDFSPPKPIPSVQHNFISNTLTSNTNTHCLPLIFSIQRPPLVESTITVHKFPVNAHPQKNH